MIKVGISSSLMSPIHCIYAAVSTKNGIYTLPHNVITYTEWGQLPFNHNSLLEIEEDTFDIDIIWLSIFECQIYRYSHKFNRDIIQKGINVLIGCTLFGNVCIWRYNNMKSEILLYDKGFQFEQDIITQLNNHNYKICISKNESFNIEELCLIFKKTLFDEYEIESLDYIEIDNLMKQYSYRYLPIFIHNKYKNADLIHQCLHIEQILNDGTFCKVHDDGLLKMHKGGIPQKISIRWNVGKDEYIFYFWFEFELFTAIFERFYGAHPETKTDFIIHIDAENKKYELALFRQGLKEPHIIPEDAYQLLVFKNKFEDYRSENYNQERGAWIW